MSGRGEEGPRKRLKQVARRLQRGQSSRGRRIVESDSDSEPDVVWDPSKTLSQHDHRIRAALFKDKYRGQCLSERRVLREELASYGVTRCFERLGWGGVLDLGGEDIDEEAVVEWMSTLKRVRGDRPQDMQLVGRYNGREVVMTVDTIRAMFGVDTGIQEDYANQGYQYPSESTLAGHGMVHDTLWHHRLATIFHLTQDQASTYRSLKRVDLKPLAKILFRICISNIQPRESDQSRVRNKDVSILYDLMTATLHVSFAWVVINNIWAMYETKERTTIPHAFIIHRFLAQEGMFGAYDPVPVSPSRHPTIGQESFTDLSFRTTEEGYEIWDNKQGVGHLERFTAEELRRRREQTSGRSASAPYEAGTSTSRFEFDRLFDVLQGMDTRLHEMQTSSQDQWNRTDQQLEQFRGELRENQGLIRETREELREQGRMIDEIRTGTRAQAYMGEYYQYQNWQYNEELRHYHDYRANVPYTTPQQHQQPDWPSLNPESNENVSYPVPPAPVYYPYNQADPNYPYQGQTQHDPDQSQSFFYGIFGQPPRPPQ